MTANQNPEEAEVSGAATSIRRKRALQTFALWSARHIQHGQYTHCKLFLSGHLSLTLVMLRNRDEVGRQVQSCDVCLRKSLV